METDSLRLLRQRRTELRANLEQAKARVNALEAEIHQIDVGVAAMESDNALAATGNDASLRAVAHHARMTNPEAQGLTMKQLVLKALSEHFKAGATANELLDYFAMKWGRDDITRTSLSPQLSRLKVEQKIALFGKTWMMREKFDEQYGPLLAEVDANLFSNENEPPSGNAGGSDADHDDGTNVIAGPDQPIPAPGSTS